MRTGWRRREQESPESMQLRDEQDRVLDVDDLVKRINELELAGIEVPEFHIDGWPNILGLLKISLGKKQCLIVRELDKAGLFKLVQKKLTLTCFISSGLIAFDAQADHPYRFFASGYWTFDTYYTVGDSSLNRAGALLLFHQFREEICTKALQIVRGGVEEHREVEDMVKEALKPFLPTIMLDRLN